MFKQLWRGVLIAALLILIGTTFFPIAQAAPSDLRSELRWVWRRRQSDPAWPEYARQLWRYGAGAGWQNRDGGFQRYPLIGLALPAQRPAGSLVWRCWPLRLPPVGFDTIPTDVAVQPDGKIVIVGRNRFVYYQGASDFLVMRVLADGSNLDFSFAGTAFSSPTLPGRTTAPTRFSFSPTARLSSVEKLLSAMITISRSRVTAPAATPTPALTTTARRRLTWKVTRLRMPSPGRTMGSWCWSARARPLPANLLCCA